ncbi:MAG TPA: nicotinamide mononucleotide transporter [Alphaproteobacteria bacterium]|nr:nicotinamide mononucleotide transporter [Alphaproteobacteria bacterium]
MGTVFQDIFAYYGLDWLTMVFGLSGGYLVANQNPVGFVVNFVASICALIVAIMSSQYGFIVANIFFMGIAMKGYWGWSKPAEQPQIQAAE